MKGLLEVSFNCELNNYFESCGKEVATEFENSQGNFGPYTAKKLSYKKISINIDDLYEDLSLSCCGITELVFNFLDRQDIIKLNALSYRDFDHFIMAIIRLGVDNNDKRMLVCGIPTKVGTNSGYNIIFYRKLRRSLKRFGFIETSRPYVNENSGNTIVMLVGKLP